jgi:dihydroorotase
MSVGPTFDLLLQGGRVIDPGSGTDGLRDVAIRNGKIAVVQSGVLPSSAMEVVDVTGKVVLPGLIDTHAHVYQYVTADVSNCRATVRRPMHVGCAAAHRVSRGSRQKD